jgi:protein O-GlcNAc transferase
VIYWQSGDFEQAAREMRAAIAIRSDDPDAYLMLGSVLNKKGDLDGAQSALQSAIRLDPANPGPYNTLGEVLKRKGDIEGSRKAFATGAQAIEKKNRELGKMLQKTP